MTGTFKDHFSGQAHDYARYRPDYPPALFDWLAATAPGRARAWDCATGTGQAARALRDRFDEVIATDASAKQIASAGSAPGIAYRVAAAEDSGIEPGSCDAITVAQAAHWFDLPAFYREARRVARPGGLLVLWTYAFVELPGQAGELMREFGHGLLAPWWPPERALVESGYRTLPLPASELEVPKFAMEVRWTLDDLLGYIGTWSATRRYVAATGNDPLPGLDAALGRTWDHRDRRRAIRWPLHVRACRLAG